MHLRVPSRATDELTAAVRTNEIHLLRTVGTKSAFVAANAGFAVGGQSRPTLFAFFFHFQRHLFQTTVGRFRATEMHKTNSIIMHAPKMSIFETAANLELWPKILPHYRYIRYLERGDNRHIVVMAATRSGIPIKWTSEEIIDRERVEVHFNHLKAFTKGMHVVWTFNETPDGVRVEIMHELNFRIPLLGPIMEAIIGDFFIGNVANKTLSCMKKYVESTTKNAKVTKEC